VYARAVRKRARSYVFLDFTDRELVVIQYRVSGMTISEIAAHMRSTYSAIESVFKRLYPKAGVHSEAELKEWAVENCLDGPTPPDTPETAEVPTPKVRKRYKGQIKMGRLQRAMGEQRLPRWKDGRPRLSQFEVDMRWNAR
jgi:DNA-binding CsgD family transcriptional regulator